MLAALTQGWREGRGGLGSTSGVAAGLGGPWGTDRWPRLWVPVLHPPELTLRDFQECWVLS